MSTQPKTHVRRLATARFVSITGGAASYTALMYAVFELTHSPVWLGVTLFLTFGTGGFVSPIAGAIGDRFDRKRVMVVSNLCSSALFALLALTRTPDAMLLVAFLTALVEAPFVAASGASIPSLAGEEHIGWANGLIAVGRSGGIMVGPVIGGALVAGVGPQWVFALNAVTFLISATLVASVHGRFSERRDGEEHLAGVWEGFHFLWNDPVLRAIALAWVVMVTGMGMVMVADIPFVHVFGAGVVAYGTMIAVWGTGSVIGSLGGRLLTPRNEIPVLVASVFVVAIGQGFASISPWLALAIALIGIAGFGDGIMNVAEQGIRQRRTPDAIRSRVMAAADAIWQVVFACSFLVGGFAVRWIGARGVYGFAGLTTLAAGLMLLPILRHSREEARLL